MKFVEILTLVVYTCLASYVSCKSERSTEIVLVIMILGLVFAIVLGRYF